jgi:hypothetical protein
MEKGRMRTFLLVGIFLTASIKGGEKLSFVNTDTKEAELVAIIFSVTESNKGKDTAVLLIETKTPQKWVVENIRVYFSSKNNQEGVELQSKSIAFEALKIRYYSYFIYYDFNTGNITGDSIITVKIKEKSFQLVKK